MSLISARIARQLEALRGQAGSYVLFGGVPYRVITEQVSGAKCGEQAISRLGLNEFVASADPRVFVFSPRLFVPVTSVVPPQEGSLLVWHNLNYLVTLVTYRDIDTDTNAIDVFCLRKVWT